MSTSVIPSDTKKQALDYVKKTSDESLAIREKFIQEHSSTLVEASYAIHKSLKAGGKVLFMGNGGSAADSQHTAAEMVGRMLKERRPLAAIALTTDTSIITAVANDYSYEEIFSKQVEALAQPQDIVVAISTSGNSKNVLRAVEAAKKIGCKIIALTGGSGGKLKDLSDFWLNASAGKNSSRIQETHIFALHSLVDLNDQFFLEGS